jgi:hypothetical protein
MLQSAQELLNQANRYASENNNEAAVDAALLAVKSYPDDPLITDLHERISISGYYSSNPQHKELAKTSCEFIASNKQESWSRKNLARQNYTWYAPSLAELAPSTRHTPVDFIPKYNYKATNPSLAVKDNKLWMIQRTVNYLIRPDGSYNMRGDSAIRTINYLLELDDDFNVLNQEIINYPDDLPPAKYPLVIGFEDSRLFFWRGEAWCTSTVRELTQDGWCEIVLAKISDIGSGQCKLTDWQVIHPNFCDKQHEKNWMPLIYADQLYFIYSSDPARIIDYKGNLVSEKSTNFASDSYRGGGSAVPFDNGYLTLVHESTGMPEGRRRYLHRFVWYDQYGNLKKHSSAFYLKSLGIEFSPGFTAHPSRNSLVIGFGLEDRESWLAEVSSNDVRSMLRSV